MGELIGDAVHQAGAPETGAQGHKKSGWKNMKWWEEEKVSGMSVGLASAASQEERPSRKSGQRRWERGC